MEAHGVVRRRNSLIILDIRLTDGEEVVRFTRRPRFTNQEASWYWFLLEVESTPGGTQWGLVN
jgi:hypothetical protein